MLGGSPVGSTPEAAQSGGNGAYAYTLNGATATYAANGSSAIIVHGVILYATTVGNIVVNAQPTSAIVKRAILGTPASYAAAGSPATLHLIRNINGQPGAYIYGGFSAVMQPGYMMAAQPGAYATAPGAISANTKRTLIGGGSSYATRGASATLGRSYVILGAPSSIAVTGRPGAISAGYTVNVPPGAYRLVGGLGRLAISHTISGQMGTYAIGTVPTMGHVQRQVIGLFGQYALAVSAGVLDRTRIVAMSATPYAVTGRQAMTYAGRQILGTPGADVVSTVAMTGTVVRGIKGLPAAIGVVGRSAQVSVVRGFQQAQPMTTAVGGSPAQLSVKRVLQGPPILVELLVLSGQLTYSGNPGHGTESTYAIALDMQPSVNVGVSLDATNISGGG